MSTKKNWDTLHSFFCTKPLETSAHFPATKHPNLDEPHCKALNSHETSGYWTAQYYSEAPQTLQNIKTLFIKGNISQRSKELI